MTRRHPSASPGLCATFGSSCAPRQPAAAAAPPHQEYTPEQFTQPFCDFMTENPTAFHVVEYCKAKLHEASFQELRSRESWAAKIHPGGNYWTTRNGSALIAFTVGRAYKPGNGVAMIAGHIDANTAKLKPVSAKPVNEAGCIQLGVAPYAAGLNPTWWDRDLGIAGRVVVRNPDTGKSATRLVKLGWPVAKIATVAAHLSQPAFFGDANLETRMTPIIGLASAYSTAEQQPLGNPGEFVHGQPPELVRLIAGELGISYSQIANWDLELYDFQPAQVFGMRKELITAGRLDDKLCSWAAMIGLLTARAREDDGYVRLVSLFDNEEIGGKLRQGHGSTFLPATIERMVESLTHSHSAKTPYGVDILGQTYAQSFLIASDVSHAGHPNFLENYMQDHVPTLNTGIAIKHDPNGGFSTDAVSAAVLMRVAELIGAKVQPYQARNDVRAGGSIGPILSSVMGCRATDAGIVQLSMHSVRASTGALDPGLGVLFYKGFLENWEKIDNEYAP
ncbi:vacuolar aspartyl aminopeptidase Lap4 [Beauveria brongniartii RCEF 3172]|uniref:Vacuolar aspartyl aminopeptidase Lap4 n=1 Tax=Beauveria brongniartii RCEF 3172 TaxID=1081107 RepID=A0A166Z480_9HYPO|nr:vacuolar aspartyl aminopeptidase Lap4 [Beauveria brongniartii RCEF 3172]